jgi:hypothetical protein
MLNIRKNFNPTSAEITWAPNQPQVDRSIKYFFKAGFSKPELYITIAAIAASFIAPPLISIPILLSVLALDVCLFAARFFVLPGANFLLKKGPNRENAQITLSDGVKLTGLWNQKGDIRHRKLLILFPGNDFSTGNGELSSVAKEKFDTIEMNYRGTNNSSGLFASHKKLVEDGIEIVAAAKKLGYSDISLFGYSLGGSIAPHVKDYFDDQENSSLNLALYICNTFQRSDEIFSCTIKNPLGKIVTKYISKFFLKCIGWDYFYKPEYWKRLKGIKIITSGGKLDQNIPPEINLAPAIAKIDQNNVTIKDGDHYDLNLIRRILNS